ncbi:MAG: exodeoxyribonuclease VII small subunit [Thiomargarita sp.]|nr:exodeoxyribonuclease VII small subunit [Thiomargarita sp.]
MPRKTETYLKNYQKLQEIAEKISNIDKPDIDQLVKMIEEATKAYTYCQNRIENVEKALAKK